MRIDLHCHSLCSDGELEPSAVAERALGDAVELFCLTDHDTTAGYPATLAGAGSMRVVRGVEVSCQFAGRSIHLLVYEPTVGCEWSRIDGVLQSVAGARRERLREMARRLRERGIQIDADALLEEAGSRVVGRPDMARALVRVGAVRSIDEAFRHFLQDRGPLDIPSARLDLLDAITLTRECGARTSLAHPHVYGEKIVRAICQEFAGKGLGGIEAYYAAYRPSQCKVWAQMAKQFGLVATGGSDMHKPNDDLPMGVELDPADADAVLQFLQ